MSSKIATEDLRSIKTKKALYTAMFSLLRTLSFRKITIKEICEEAYVSRATFYAHFVDKYDLLRHWLPELCPFQFSSEATYEDIERVINQRVNENKAILKHLLCNFDDETYNILFEFALSGIQLRMESIGGEGEVKDVVLSSFYAGGLISYLMWQVNHRFPSNVPTINLHLYDMMRGIQDWQSKHDTSGGGVK